MKEVDLSDVFEKILSNSVRSEKIKSGKEIKVLSEKTILGFHTNEFGVKRVIFDKFPLENVLMGFSLSFGVVLFSKNSFCISNGDLEYRNELSILPTKNFPNLSIEENGWSTIVYSEGKRIGCFDRNTINSWEQIINEINPLLKDYFNDKRNRERQLKEENRLNTLKKTQSNILMEFDKDGNGVVDIVDGDDFMSILRKHEKTILELDKNYIQQFVKVSLYLKIQKENVQYIFESIKDTPNQEVLNEYVEILKDKIHIYNLTLLISLKMIVSLIEDDMISFYEIYERFDTLNLFDSKHEKDISQNLSNIGDGLDNLMTEIKIVGNTICSSLDNLSSITEESNKTLSKHLSNIDSTLKVGNLINTINLYQNYKTRKLLSK